MKFLFSSSDAARVEAFSKTAQASGIRCEIRRPSQEAEPLKVPGYPELWICNEADLPQASALLSRGLRGR